jgi:hypothetical protein
MSKLLFLNPASFQPGRRKAHRNRNSKAEDRKKAFPIQQKSLLWLHYLRNRLPCQFDRQRDVKLGGIDIYLLLSCSAQSPTLSGKL